jgi:hypothetical protein
MSNKGINLSRFARRSSPACSNQHPATVVSTSASGYPRRESEVLGMATKYTMAFIAYASQDRSEHVPPYLICASVATSRRYTGSTLTTSRRSSGVWTFRSVGPIEIMSIPG